MNVDATANDRRNLGVLDEMRPSRLLWNLPPARLVADALTHKEAQLAATGALVATTGQFTGRSPKDKFFVDHPEFHAELDWGPGNQAMSAPSFAALRDDMVAAARGKPLYVQDLWAGAAPEHRLKVRVVTEQAWHSLFARNMLIRPAAADLSGFEPDWTVLQMPGFFASPERHGTRSGTVIAIDLRARLVLIGGTAYAGEIKKAVFTVLNYLLPERGVLPMHCSANVVRRGAAPCSSACPAPARPRCRPIPRAR